LSDIQHKEKEEQAETLRRLVYDAAQDDGTEREHTAKETRDIDILNLPPRKEVHGKKQGRVRLKTSTYLKRFLIVVFALMIILLTIYFVYGEAIIPMFFLF
jgi:predicted nucleotidyltransferase